MSADRVRGEKGMEADASQSLKAIWGVRELIVSGAMQPGERLSELVLVKRLGLSRTPVRAALSHLASEGLVEAIPGGGYAVMRFQREDIVDAIELRGVLEGTAARLAAERGVTATRLREARQVLEAIDAVIAGLPGSARFEEYVELNAQFHGLMANMSSSSVLVRELDRVISLPFASPSAFLKAQAELPEFREVLVQAQQQHLAILEAIENREGARAEALGREHARLARRNLDRVIDNDGLRKAVPGLTLIVR